MVFQMKIFLEVLFLLCFVFTTITSDCVAQVNKIYNENNSSQQNFLTALEYYDTNYFFNLQPEKNPTAAAYFSRSGNIITDYDSRNIQKPDDFCRAHYGGNFQLCKDAIIVLLQINGTKREDIEYRLLIKKKIEIFQHFYFYQINTIEEYYKLFSVYDEKIKKIENERRKTYTFWKEFYETIGKEEEEENDYEYDSDDFNPNIPKKENLEELISKLEIRTIFETWVNNREYMVGAMKLYFIHITAQALLIEKTRYLEVKRYCEYFGGN